MSEENESNGGAGGVPPKAGGDGEKKVSWENYDRLMAQRKSDQLKMQEMNALLETFKSEKEKLNESELLKEKKYEEILALKEQTLKAKMDELNEIKTSRDSLEKELIDGAKIQAVVDMLPGRLKKPEYYNFIDTDKVVINPETNLIDVNSAQSVANTMLKDYHELIDIKDKSRLPNDAGNSSSGITKEAWLKLDVKEKRRRLKDVINK